MKLSDACIPDQQGGEVKILDVPPHDEYLRLSADGQFSYNENLIREATDPTGVMLKHLIDVIRKECEK